MEITTTAFKRCVVIKTSGRIDGSNAPELRTALKELTEDGQFNIVLDMSEINFMASAGWWVLIDIQKTCQHLNRGELVMACVAKSIKDSLSLVGMLSYFKIFDDITSAVGSF
jgi:anti-sigma B factor antagonist